MNKDALIKKLRSKLSDLRLENWAMRTQLKSDAKALNEWAKKIIRLEGKK